MGKTMRNKRKRLIYLMSVVAVMSSLMGISYAHWSGSLQVIASITTGRWILDYEDGSGHIYGKIACEQGEEGWKVELQNEEGEEGSGQSRYSSIADDYNMEVFAEVTLTNDGTTAYNLCLKDIAANIEISDGITYQEKVEKVKVYRATDNGGSRIRLEECEDWFLLEMGATETFYIKLYEDNTQITIPEDLTNYFTNQCRVTMTLNLKYGLGLSQNAWYSTKIRVDRRDFPVEMVQLPLDILLPEGEGASGLDGMPVPLPIDPMQPDGSETPGSGGVPIPLPADPVDPVQPDDLETPDSGGVPTPLPADPVDSVQPDDLETSDSGGIPTPPVEPELPKNWEIPDSAAISSPTQDTTSELPSSTPEPTQVQEVMEGGGGNEE
ncbi:hypothetical protein PBV87_16860 [Niameybacter massiliensis]|uniref:Uncharacterized protein n=1 Tax=Holtiella tumoricola TaxID=3018743 RepID=A0AA42DQJ8_9FIRM|nr:hypothetical protein [Holtiella tumoricola]MDA3733149.1 hypothetical protein [Holtiella tumoricola]